MTVYTPTAEEGLFTPELKFGGQSTGLTYATQFGTFTRIGDLVFFNIHLHLSSKGSSTGDATIVGLPWRLQQAMLHLVVRDAPIPIDNQLLAVPDYPSDVDLTLYKILANRVLENLDHTNFTNDSFVYVSGTAKIVQA